MGAVRKGGSRAIIGPAFVTLNGQRVRCRLGATFRGGFVLSQAEDSAEDQQQRKRYQDGHGVEVPAHPAILSHWAFAR